MHGLRYYEIYKECTTSTPSNLLPWLQVREVPSLLPQHCVQTSWISLPMVRHLLPQPIIWNLLSQQLQARLSQPRPLYHQPPQPRPHNTRYQPSHQPYNLDRVLRRHCPMKTRHSNPTPLCWRRHLITLCPRKNKPPRSLTMHHSSWLSSFHKNKGIWGRSRRQLIIWRLPS